MSAPHDPEHERRLVELCAQGSDPRGELERSDLGACPECRSTLEAMLSSEEVLMKAGVEFRRADEAAGGTDAAPGEERLEQFLRSRLGAPGAGPADRPRRWLLPTLVAAAALLAIGILFVITRERAEPPVYLGTHPPTDLSPSGAVERWDDFTWKVELLEGAWQKVLVYDAEGEPTAAPVLESPRLTEPRWSPSPETISKLPRRVRWEIRVLDSSGVRGSASSEAWLSSR